MGEDLPHKADYRHRRRSTRPGLRIPIQVEGKDADGKPFRETTYTLAINRHGARVSLKISLRPGDNITVTNLQKMQQPCPFRVIGRGATSVGQEPAWGIECLEPDRNFWGVYFPEKGQEPSRPEGIDALLECATCRSREMVELSLDQYHGLIAQSSTARPCQKCGMTTEWRFGSVEVTREEVASPALSLIASALFPPGGTERRHAERLVVLLPLRITDQNGREEFTRTENLSKLGICFMSDLAMQEGDTVFVAVGPDPGSKRPARIVWCRPSREKGRTLYGVRLEETE
jgi:hypothetical protein